MIPYEEIQISPSAKFLNGLKERIRSQNVRIPIISENILKVLRQADSIETFLIREEDAQIIHTTDDFFVE